MLNVSYWNQWSRKWMKWIYCLLFYSTRRLEGTLMKYRPNPRKNSLNMTTLFSSWDCWLYGVQLQCKLFQSNNASKLVWQLPWSHQNSRWILQWPWKKSEKWYQENIGKLRSRLRNPPGTWMIGMMARRKIMLRFALLLWFVSNGSRHIICFI